MSSLGLGVLVAPSSDGRRRRFGVVCRGKCGDWDGIDASERCPDEPLLMGPSLERDDLGPGRMSGEIFPFVDFVMGLGDVMRVDCRPVAVLLLKVGSGSDCFVGRVLAGEKRETSRLLVFCRGSILGFVFSADLFLGKVKLGFEIEDVIFLLLFSGFWLRDPSSSEDWMSNMDKLEVLAGEEGDEAVVLEGLCSLILVFSVRV